MSSGLPLAALVAGERLEGFARDERLDRTWLKANALSCKGLGHHIMHSRHIWLPTKGPKAKVPDHG